MITLKLIWYEVRIYDMKDNLFGVFEILKDKRKTQSRFVEVEL